MAEARVTSEVALVEQEGIGQRATAEFALVEYGALALYATALVVWVESEADPLLDYYAVGDGHDVPAGLLTRLSPQPVTAGMLVTRRSHAANGKLLDEFKYVVHVYAVVGSEADYRDILDQYGLLAALENEVTITGKDDVYAWSRYNATAVRPAMGEDVKFANHFPRDIQIVLKYVEPAL